MSQSPIWQCRESFKFGMRSVTVLPQQTGHLGEADGPQGNIRFRGRVLPHPKSKNRGTALDNSIHSQFNSVNKSDHCDHRNFERDLSLVLSQQDQQLPSNFCIVSLGILARWWWRTSSRGSACSEVVTAREWQTLINKISYRVVSSTSNFIWRVTGCATHHIPLLEEREPGIPQTVAQRGLDALAPLVMTFEGTLCRKG